MMRQVFLSGIALAASVALGRQLASISKDWARYNRLSAMSDEPSLRVAVLREAANALRRREGLLNSLRSDALRYARMRSM
jgi:hypothetical protein